MKRTIDLSKFRDAFERMGRKENFSYEGLELLFNYFEEVDENMELDPIAICCDFNEDTWQAIANDYSIDLDEEDDDETKENLVVDYLQDKTLFIGKTETGLIYQAF